MHAPFKSLLDSKVCLASVAQREWSGDFVTPVQAGRQVSLFSWFLFVSKSSTSFLALHCWLEKVICIGWALTAVRWDRKGIVTDYRTVLLFVQEMSDWWELQASIIVKGRGRRWWYFNTVPALFSFYKNGLLRVFYSLSFFTARAG